jgi:hypothetical protein
VYPLLNSGAGALTPGPAAALTGSPREIRLGRTLAGGHTDLFAVFTAAPVMQVLLGDGAGGFSPGPQAAIGGPAAAMDVGDLDNDGDDDVVVGVGATLIELRNAGGAFITTAYPLGLAPQRLLLADVNRDGLKDVIFTSSNRFAVMLNRPGQPFDTPRMYFKGYGISNLAAADLDGDADNDLVLATLSGTVLTVQNLGDASGQNAGLFNDGQGCATGSYYLDLNVAFQPTSAPDPVIQLQQQFDAWRTAHIGTPDAVHSGASLAPGTLAPNSSATLTITLRDWQDTPVSAAAAVAVAPAPGEPALVAIGPVTPQGNGVYRVTITAGGQTGAEALRITADDGVRPVALMPDTVVTVASPLGPKSSAP